MRFFFIILFFATLLFAQSPPATDSAHVNSRGFIPDTLVLSDTLGGKNDSTEKKPPIVLSHAKDSLPLKKLLPDTTFVDGVYAGIGVGWSLGNFDAERLWERTLPGTLLDLHLYSTTLQVLPDTTQTDSLLRKGDTSSLRFSIKDKPSTYNMTFPFSISLTKYRKNDRLSAALSFSLFSKTQKSSVSMLNDSLSRRIDLRQNFLLYSLSLQLLYAKRISPIYFSVDGIDRSHLLLGLSITPLMRIKTTGSTKRYSDDYRTIGIEDTIKKLLLNSESYGFSMSIRTGISTTQQLSSGALEIDLLYSMSWNDYFYQNGNRVYRGALNKNDNEADKTLSFLSNRLEINLTLLRKSSRNKKDETAQP
jgi:hypothetical protein